jgi:hypothetical protein
MTDDNLSEPAPTRMGKLQWNTAGRAYCAGWFKKWWYDRQITLKKQELLGAFMGAIQVVLHTGVEPRLLDAMLVSVCSSEELCGTRKRPCRRSCRRTQALRREDEAQLALRESSACTFVPGSRAAWQVGSKTRTPINMHWISHFAQLYTLAGRKCLVSMLMCLQQIT